MMISPSFDLGAWIGRRQAFGSLAGRAAASEVVCLRTIRERKLYLTLTESWEGFCERYAGISRSQADRLIHYFDEFGINYFHITQLTRISPETYRAIAHHVSNDGISFNGEVIPIVLDNTPRLAAAIRQLRPPKPTRVVDRTFRAIAAQLRDASRRLSALPEITPDQKRELASILAELQLIAL